MVLPRGVDKASGLIAAADRLGLSPPAIVAIGDAENDQAMLQKCGLGVAVENALDVIKAVADHVTAGCAGEGVARFVDEHLLNDCRAIVPRPRPP
jgi:hypothetical protein